MTVKLGSYFFCFPRHKLFLFVFSIFLSYFIFCLPPTLFRSPTSTILLSKNGKLLNAKIASDGQWRFPQMDSVPEKFKDAITAYEDRSFYQHIGISWKGLARAVVENVKSKKIVSGGSTITMQIARLSRGGKRSFRNKIVESIWALRLEWRYDKEELMKIYASNAPFGGNVVGLETAAWRYYGQSPFDLSWAEIATLAVLPNSPALVHPGKNRALLLQKRDKVLKTLYNSGKIDKTTYELSLEEPLISAPQSLPSFAPHLIDLAVKQGKNGQRIHSTLDYQKQLQFTEIMKRHQSSLNMNHINNAALLIIDVNTNEVVTYIGNSSDKIEHQKYVDLIQAPRSSGSILKPFLYAAMIQEGMLHNKQLIPDIPMYFDQFAPKNYDDKFEGAVKAEDALAKSLNIPAVFLLKKYGVHKFLHKLKELGQKNINKNADYYGLSLILGGAETSLWDVTKAYSGMAKTLNFYYKNNLYSREIWDSPILWKQEKEKKITTSKNAKILDAGAIYEVFDALLAVNRPFLESSWRQYSSSQKIAWKTGTSFGNRDAWAVGCTPNYVVGVIVGNATGEGRPAIIGTTAAGPILFNIFSHLSASKNWFSPPHDELETMTICQESGYRNTSNCTKTETILVHKNALRSASCHFHKVILTDLEEKYRFHQECVDGIEVKTISPFVLPALQAYYYQNSHPNYKPLPPFHPNCKTDLTEQIFSLIYPQPNAKIVGTIDLGGKNKNIIFEATYPDKKAKLFWHVDSHFLGVTEQNHTIEYQPEKGEHTLTVVDEKGNQKRIRFSVLDAN